MPKKGDAVVLEQKHSSHDIKMKRRTWTTYQIARVERVDKQGKILGVALPGGEKPALLGSYRLLTVEDEEKQEGARRLLRKVTPEQNEWPDIETMRKAILEAFLWDRVL